MPSLTASQISLISALMFVGFLTGAFFGLTGSAFSSALESLRTGQAPEMSIVTMFFSMQSPRGAILSAVGFLIAWVFAVITGLIGAIRDPGMMKLLGILGMVLGVVAPILSVLIYSQVIVLTIDADKLHQIASMAPAAGL